jgi:type II secretory pathway component PulM
MGTFLAQWRRTKKPIAKKVWESLTPRERDWLTMQGVKAER